MFANMPLQPLSERAPARSCPQTRKIAKAVVNILGGAKEISTVVRFYIDNDSSNNDMEPGQLAESIALTVRKEANAYTPSTVRVVGTPSCLQVSRVQTGL